MRLIDADALIKYCEDNWIPLNVDAVNEQPTIEPERKKGEWNRGLCSVCGYDWGKDAPIANVPPFCPNCGAEMQKEKKKND